MLPYRNLIENKLMSNASMVAACHTATSYFNLWLKDVGYGTVDANIYPTAGSALNIVVTVTWGIIADRTGQNYLMVVIVQVLMIFSNILLSVWYIPRGGLMFAFYLSYAGSAATPVLIVSEFGCQGRAYRANKLQELGQQTECGRSKPETASRRHS